MWEFLWEIYLCVGLLSHNVQLCLYPHVLCSPRKHENAISSHAFLHVALSNFLIFANMINFKLYLIADLICFFVITNTSECFFHVLAAIWVSLLWIASPHTLSIFYWAFCIIHINLWYILVNSRHLSLDSVIFCQYLFSISVCNFSLLVLVNLKSLIYLSFLLLLVYALRNILLYLRSYSFTFSCSRAIIYSLH